MVQVGGAVGNYQVIRLLGEGGMGTVFEAVHQYIGRRAAIKVLHAELSQNPQFVTRFLNEARAVTLVRHPGLVEIYEFGLLPDGTAFCAMEFLEGQSLYQRMAAARGLWGVEDLRLVRQIAQALQVAHDKGIVHRDLKPENVMVVPDPERPGRLRPKILDFGIAKMASHHQSSAGPRYKTQTGVALGTPAYMAPEQCIGEAILDGKVDVYALGVILHEMVSGKLPFDSELAAEIMVKHVREAPPPLRALDGAVPPELEGLVLAMLAKAPAERPTMAQVAEALQALLEAAKASGTQAAAPGLDDAQEDTSAGAPAVALPLAPAWSEEEERTEISVPAEPSPLPAGSEPPLAAPGPGTGPSAVIGLGSTVAHPTLAAPATGQLVSVGPHRASAAALPSLLRSPRIALAAAATLLLALALSLLRSPRPATGPPGGPGAPHGGAVAARSVSPPAPAPPPPRALCLVTSTPEGAQVLRASDEALLGQTPLRLEQPEGGAGLDLVLRLSRHADQRVALSWGPDCRRQVTLTALPHPRPPGRRNDRSQRPARPAPPNHPSVPIPIIR